MNNYNKDYLKRQKENICKTIIIPVTNPIIIQIPHNHHNLNHNNNNINNNNNTNMNEKSSENNNNNEISSNSTNMNNYSLDNYTYIHNEPSFVVKLEARPMITERVLALLIIQFPTILSSIFYDTFFTVQRIAKGHASVILDFEGPKPNDEAKWCQQAGDQMTEYFRRSLQLQDLTMSITIIPEQEVNANQWVNLPLTVPVAAWRTNANPLLRELSFFVEPPSPNNP